MEENKVQRTMLNKIDAESVKNTLTKMEASGFIRRKYVPTSDKSHLERYKHVSNAGEKVSIVYDTVAQILTVDCEATTFDKLKKYLPTDRKNKSISGSKNENKKNGKVEIAEKKEQPYVPLWNPKLKFGEQEIKTRKRISPTRVEEKESQGDLPKVEEQTQTESIKTNGKTQAQKAEKKAKAKSGGKNVVFDDVRTGRLEWIIKGLRENGKYKVRQAKSANGNEYIVSEKKNTVTITPFNSGKVVVNGKDSELFKAIVKQFETHINVKLLKKHIPTALTFMSEASKIDLSNGLNDMQSINKISDYSALLNLPYRALEKLIFDLQHAENINVRMVGQAYEKDENGNYSLKKGYLKRINSIIYSEVMVALYKEYFEIRNYYLHTDNSEDYTVRQISTKDEAKKILDNLLAVIEYNCRKLKEIGFRTVDEQ